MRCSPPPGRRDTGWTLERWGRDEREEERARLIKRVRKKTSETK